MHACTPFFCLLCIPTTCSSTLGQSLRTDFLEISRATKSLRTIEAFLLLLVLTFLPATRALAQTYPVADTFSGSGSLSSNWTDTTADTYVTTARVGGSAVPSVSGEQSLATYTGATFTADQYAQVVFVAHSSDAGNTGPCVRMTVSGNGVCYLADYGLIWLQIGGAGGYSITDGCPIPSSGDTIRIFVVGNAYTCMDITTGASASGTDGTYTSGSPAILVDQRNSTVYALALFQSDCLPSCNGPSGSSTISLGSFANTALNPGFDNTATSYSSVGSTINNGSTATYGISAGSLWHSPLGSSSWISGIWGSGPNGSNTPPNGDYIYTTTFTTGPNQSVASATGTMTVLADDTVAVYLNGVLIQDSGGPMGPDNSYDHCSDTGPNCITPVTFTFTGITNGVNVLKFDVKQVNEFSEGLDYVGTINLNTGPVTITPNTAQLYAGQTQQFQANTGVSWSVVGAGTISSTGLYTAPATIASQQTVTVTATSQTDSTQTASATITLEPPIIVSISPATSALNGGQTQQFAATVTNSSNTAVTWTTSPAGTGTVSASGLYTAPATIGAQQTVTITATSQADATSLATATITLNSGSGPSLDLQITSPSNNASFTPGQALAMSVISASNTSYSEVAVAAGDPIGLSNLQTAVPAQFSITLPSALPCGSYSLVALGNTTAGQEAVSAPVNIDVERSDIPVSLASSKPRITFEAPGGMSSFTLQATFSDSTTCDVTRSSYVTYTSLNPQVFTVDANGVITSASPGNGILQATYTNNGQSLQSGVGISVLQGALAASAYSISFGTQPIGAASSSQQIVLTNVLPGPVTINNVSVTGDFSQFNNCTAVTPGSSCTINTTFSPTQLGTRGGWLTISTGTTSVPLRLAISGVGVAH